MLAEVAVADAGRALQDGCLSLAALGSLGPGRQVNLVRWWLRQAGLRPPPAARLASAMSAFLSAREDARPLLRWEDGEVRRYRGRLYALRPTADPADFGPLEAGTIVNLGPGLGRFGLVAGLAGGLPAGERWVIRYRSGGGRLRPAAGRASKRLKDLCQEAGIVPWMRDRLPLVCVGDRLAAIGDLWLDADLALPAGEPGLQPLWEIVRLETAITEVQRELEGLYGEMTGGDAPAEVAALLDVHTMILRDPTLVETPKRLTAEQHCNAEWALTQQMNVLVEQFEQIEDAYLRERKADVVQIVERILKRLLGKPGAAVPAGAEQHTILVAHDLSPADVIQFKTRRYGGFLTDVGGVTSHTAIVARSLAVPAVVATHNARQLIRENELLILDGTNHVVIVNPDKCGICSGF